MWCLVRMHLEKVVKALLFVSQLAFLSLSILCPPHIEHSVPTFVNPLCRLSVTRERADSVPNLSVVAPWSHRSAPWMQFNTIGTLSSTRASQLLRHIRSPHRSRDWFDSFWCSCKHHNMPSARHKTMVKFEEWSKKVKNYLDRVLGSTFDCETFASSDMVF